jgi:hypothetical protein
LWHLPAGTHTIRIVKEGFAPIERVIDVGDFTAIQLCQADLQPAVDTTHLTLVMCTPQEPCNVRVIAPPELMHAAIDVDGEHTSELFPRDLGRALHPEPSASLFRLGPGPHTIRIAPPGLKPIERRVTVDARMSTMIDVTIGAEELVQQ